MSTTTPAATAQRLLISFLLAAVVFEGWAIYGMSRRLSRLETRSGLGLASMLGGPDSRGAERPEPRRRDDEPTGQDERPEPRVDRPEGQERAPEGARFNEHRGPAGDDDPPRDERKGGANLERLEQDERQVIENLEAYLEVSELSEDTEAGLRAEIERIYSTRRARIEQGVPSDDDVEARMARVEADHERSEREFSDLLGEDEAHVFIIEVMRPGPPPGQRGTPPDQGKH